MGGRAVTSLLLTLLFAWGCIEGERQVETKVTPKDVTVSQGQAFISLAELARESERLKDTNVTVAGKVVSGLAFEFVAEQPYELLQEETRIWVITKDMAPKENSFVTVRGRLAAPYQIKGRSYKLAIIEEERN